jgi:protein SCO1
MLQRIRTVLWIACAIPLLALVAVGVMEYTGKADGLRSSLPGSIGGPFRLASTAGGELSSEDLKGRPFIVFFGYTHCPDICPTTISGVSSWLDALGSQGKDLKAFFISIDPERDSVASLKDYLSSFPEQVVGLTGTPEQIAEVAKAYRVFYAKHPLKDGDYSMDHSALIYLMGRDGKLASTLTPDSTSEEALAKLKRLLGVA